MGAFLYGVILQWKIDIRNKGILLTYYVVPLVFFAFMGGIFTSIDPTAKNTLIQSMTVFGVTMGAILGAPIQLVELYASETKKAYKVGGIPLWVVAINNFISAFIHLFIMSIIIFFVAPIAFEAILPLRMVHYIISLAIFIIVSLIVGTLLGLFVKNTSKLTMVSQFIFLPSIMLSGIMFPITMLPKALEIVGRILPATWGYKLMINDVLDIKLLIPQFIILIICLCLSWYKLATIRLE